MKKEEKFVLTAQGYLDLEEELNTLKTVKRPEVIKALKEARAMGDLSENADYDAARNDQAQLEARIKELEYKLEHSEIADSAKGSDTINIGSTIVVKYDDGEEDEYVIVGSVEADPFNNRISVESPIGKAVLGHKEHEMVDVESPNGSYQVEIVKVS
ncbi:MAG: transcription elongation factor GreA [Bacilli bacterium]|nr:transcription elongation factor GreA [Bacilli bacterium]